MNIRIEQEIELKRYDMLISNKKKAYETGCKRF